MRAKIATLVSEARATGRIVAEVPPAPKPPPLIFTSSQRQARAMYEYEHDAIETAKIEALERRRKGMVTAVEDIPWSSCLIVNRKLG